MKLSAHLQRPQYLAPLIESDDVVEEEQTFCRGRDLKLRTGSLRRRTRSISPNRTTATASFHWLDGDDKSKTLNDSPRQNTGKGEEGKGSDERTSGATWLSARLLLFYLRFNIKSTLRCFYPTILGRNLFWYAAVFGAITAISRAAMVDELLVFDPQGKMSLVVQHTHYMPKR